MASQQLEQPHGSRETEQGDQSGVCSGKSRNDHAPSSVSEIQIHSLAANERHSGNNKGGIPKPFPPARFINGRIATNQSCHQSGLIVLDDATT